MGNTIGSRKLAKVMKINGETMKFKTPIHANQVTENYPGHVLLESESVKHFGIRAKPLEPNQELKPKRLYFLVELPESSQDKIARRVRSGIHMTAKDRLDSLMLARRSISDLSILKPKNTVLEEANKVRTKKGTTRLKMRIPKSQIEKIMKDCHDEDEVAAKIMDLYMETHGNSVRSDDLGDRGSGLTKQHQLQLEQTQENGKVKNPDLLKLREKHVGFHPVTEGDIRLAVPSL